MAIDKFLGNSLISRIMSSEFTSVEELRLCLAPKTEYGSGDWVDISGLIAPKSAVADILDDVENGRLADIPSLDARLRDLHAGYYDLEWKWAYDAIMEYYACDLSKASVEDMRNIIYKWKDSVVGLDNLLYEDARKDFSLSMMASFGADGDEVQRKSDFIQVRGSRFEANPFVISVKEHIEQKSALGDTVLGILANL